MWFLWILCFAFSLSVEDAQKIGEKIWQNECGGTVEGLTFWNKKEDFPSMGIGHFIWYPEEYNDLFEETFPSLVTFLKENGARPPKWLESNSSCPWNTREAFYAATDSPNMQSLRKWLFDTRGLQVVFMMDRLERVRPLLMEECSSKEIKALSVLLERFSQDAKGLYALIDYLNFKGSGISPKEKYKGQGWGLLQVLQRIPANTKEPLVAFVRAAKDVLHQRIENAPPERDEARFEKGWFRRLDSYLE